MKQQSDKELLLIGASYLFTIVLFFFCSSFPELRVWGLNWWAYLGNFQVIGLILFALAGGLLSYFSPINLLAFSKSHFGENNKPLIILYVYTILLFLTSFVIFKTNTFFLGDGYQLLAKLADGSISVKFWDFGTTFLLSSIFENLSGDAGSKSLLTYQIVSVLSGVLFLLVSAFYSFILFTENIEKIVFFLGLVCGGYLLQFFGYVENYSLFLFLLTFYTLHSVKILSDKGSKTLLVILAVLLVVSHIFGLLVIPSLIYVLFRKFKLKPSIKDKNKFVRYISFILLATAFFLTYRLIRSESLFFNFILLPIIPDQFTVDNDTLFSVKHFLDSGNLLILLFPGLPIFVTFFLLRKTKISNPVSKFLVTLFLVFLAADFIVNPGIGMPRNWDLFSFAGVPLIIYAYFTLCKRFINDRLSIVVALLSIIASSLMLVPRVVVGVTPELAIRHFENYLDIDRLRGRNGYIHLINFYEKAGRPEEANKILNKMKSRFPEDILNDEAELLISHGYFDNAVPLLRRVIQLNPIHYDAYVHIGYCFLQSNVNDSALSYLEIANGINPFNASTLSLIGAAYYQRFEFEKAIKYYEKANLIDPHNHNALSGLVSVHLSLKNYATSLEYIANLFAIEETPFSYFKQAGDNYIIASAWKEARVTYAYAVKRGLDSSYVVEMQAKYPRLQVE